MYIIKRFDYNKKYSSGIAYISELKFNNHSYNYSTVDSSKPEEIYRFPSKDLACSVCRWLNKCYPYTFSVINIYKPDEKINIYECPEDCYELDENGNMLNDAI